MSPADFVEETLRTLDLLFPRSNKPGRKWLQGQCVYNDDSVVLDCGLLQRRRLSADDRMANNFEYWRDELLTLKAFFDQPRSGSITRLWFDRRNKVQWYTPWIAVLVLALTVFFGLVQSIEGALQVYKTYYPGK